MRREVTRPWVLSEPDFAAVTGEEEEEEEEEEGGLFVNFLGF